jgi:hypothetical protein
LALKTLDNLPSNISFELGSFPIQGFVRDSYKVIETEGDLELLSERVTKALGRGYSWISVDVEHSKTFSYTGIVCLV